MKEKKLNFNKLITLVCIIYIVATVAGVVLTNGYYIQHLGKGVSPINILMEAVPMMAVLAILLRSVNILQMDERLPVLFYSLILVSFGLLQIFFLIATLGAGLSVYYIINIVSILLHIVAAVVMVLVLIGKASDNLGVVCAWGALGITLVLFMTGFSIYDKEKIFYVSLFPQVAACASALLLILLFFKNRKPE